MKFVADLHIHSRYSRATSHQLTFPNLYRWALYKGLHVIGTGDFTHPGWLEEIEEYLEEGPEEGFFSLKAPFARAIDKESPPLCVHPVRFLLSAEISTIYKKNGRVRKIHDIVFAPDLSTAKKINHRLSQIGNLKSDGRPILGLDAKSLLEILLEISPQAYLVPAHVWTPWFSLFGSKSGFDRVEECFEDLSPHIFALETGLSSDPPMNWLCSWMDRYTLVSNSDAHSPSKLGREANLFDTQFSYPALFNALKCPERGKFRGTVEFYPEEGKYHLDGHRKCNVRLVPEESKKNDGICPVCGKALTLGVMNRVMELADRPAGGKRPNAMPFRSLIGLETVLAETMGVTPESKKVDEQYFKILKKLGAEIDILSHAPLNELEKKVSPLFAEAIRRVRSGDLEIAGGYDGEFGTIHIFKEEDRKKWSRQPTFFEGWEEEEAPSPSDDTINRAPEIPQESLDIKREESIEKDKGTGQAPSEGPHLLGPSQDLNESQLAAVAHRGVPMLVIAGPGTGKTKTLTCRIAHLVEKDGVDPSSILAITFTNKAAEEMRERVEAMLGERATGVTICTFHKLGLHWVRKHANLKELVIYDEKEKTALLEEKMADCLGQEKAAVWLERFSKEKNELRFPADTPEGPLKKAYQRYHDLLRETGAMDLDDLIFWPVKFMESHPETAAVYRQKYRFVFVDEYQDINLAQYRFLRALIGEETDFFAIGDPDQAIYGFRGAEVKFFLQFKNDFPTANEIRLRQNYRSTVPIVESAQCLIRHNESHIGNEIVSDVPGENIRTFEAATEKAEAEFVVHTVEKLVGGTSHFSYDSDRVSEPAIQEYGFKDIAVLYRTSSQHKTLEEAFARSGMPYRIVDGQSLWESPEMQNWKHLFHLLIRPDHDRTVKSLVDQLPGIGKKTIGELEEYARRWRKPLFSCLGVEVPGIGHCAVETLRSFQEKIVGLQKESENMSLLAERIETGFDCPLLSLSKERKETLRQIVLSFENVSELLNYIVLHESRDEFDPRAEKVSFMTLHASKGLEFPVVFIVGCEEGLLPYRREGEMKEEEEEERRLFYVGMTRARRWLYLVRSKERMRFGQRVQNPPSPYLSELPGKLVSPVQSEWKPKRKKPSTGQMSFF